MVDYVGAFNQGLNAAEAADRARKEIDAVFNELDRQLREGTGGKVSIGRKELGEAPRLKDVIAWPPKPRITYWAIVARNPCIANNPDRELARWTQARWGYPCKIVWGDTVYSCEDREALENSLAELLRDPLVGEQLYTLMQMEILQEEGATQQVNQGNGE